MKYVYLHQIHTLWKLNIRSNSHTLPKYLSSTSTNEWINSKTINSFSFLSTIVMKYKLAYLLYTILYYLYSIKLHILGLRVITNWLTYGIWGGGTYLRNRCFSCWDMLVEYHLVRRERPWRLMRKKQWIILDLCFNLLKIINIGGNLRQYIFNLCSSLKSIFYDSIHIYYLANNEWRWSRSVPKSDCFQEKQTYRRRRTRFQKKTKKTSQKSKQNHQSPKHHQLTLRKNQQIPTTTTPPLPHPRQKEINRNRQNIRVRSQHSPPPQTTNHPPRSWVTQLQPNVSPQRTHGNSWRCLLKLPHGLVFWGTHQTSGQGGRSEFFKIVRNPTIVGYLQ